MRRIPTLELLVHLHPYAFTFAILDREQRKIVAFESTVQEHSTDKQLPADSIASWLQQHSDMFGLPFKLSRAAVFSNEYTILPEKTEQPGAVFRLLGYPANEAQTYLKNKLQEHFFVYFALPDATIQLLENHLPNVEFYCSDYGFLTFYNQKLSFKKYLAAQVFGQELAICHHNGETLTYYNTFPVKAKEDLLYYLRLTYEQLQLDINEYPTYLYGCIEEKSPMYSTSYGYIRNLEIDRTLKNTLPYTYGVEDIPLHYYINVWGLGDHLST